MLLFVLLLAGSALVIGPWFVPALDPATRIFMTVTGAFVLILATILSVITKLYRKASANMAFVRTGMGGAKVVKDGGTVVVPVVQRARDR